MTGNEMHGHIPGESRVVRPVHSLVSRRTEPPVRLGDFTYVWRFDPIPDHAITTVRRMLNVLDQTRIRGRGGHDGSDRLRRSAL